jgi:hypothetical protein
MQTVIQVSTSTGLAHVRYCTPALACRVLRGGRGFGVIASKCRLFAFCSFCRAAALPGRVRYPQRGQHSVGTARLIFAAGEPIAPDCTKPVSPRFGRAYLDPPVTAGVGCNRGTKLTIEVVWSPPHPRSPLTGSAVQ